ncbi:MAG TPA: hypothetical protein VF531_12940 [Bacillota bacterium]
MPLKKQPPGIPIVRGRQKTPRIFEELRGLLRLNDEPEEDREGNFDRIDLEKYFVRNKS